MQIAKRYAAGDLRARYLRLVHLVGFSALAADPTNQPLSENQVERRGHVEGLDTHVHETRNGLWRRVRVQSREYKVTGESSLNGDAAGLQVSNFSQHDDVRILTKERLERRGERHADLGTDEHLIDSKQVVLDRVLGRHDVDVDVVDLGESRIQRRRLTRPRRTGDEHHSVRVRDRFHQLAFGTGLDSEGPEVQRQVALVEN